ncbi:MAG: hypothetical protein GWP17_02400 [Aquificales bacterium]|nr:hypothetical protein [Aquificales bacterium]
MKIAYLYDNPRRKRLVTAVALFIGWGIGWMRWLYSLLISTVYYPDFQGL